MNIGELISQLEELAEQSPLRRKTPVVLYDAPHGENFSVEHVAVDDEFVLVYIEGGAEVDLADQPTWEEYE